MTEEVFRQRVERFVQERDVPALLAEAQKLLAIYIDGDDSLDLEPVVSAQWVLQQIDGLLLSQDKQDKEFTISVVSRRHLKDIGFADEEIALLTDDDMRWIASIMETNYYEGVYEADLQHLANIVLRDKEKFNE